MHSRNSLLACAVFLVLASPAAGQPCGGVERWAVKVGADSGAGQVDLANPSTVSMHELAALPRPAIPSDDFTRHADERRVYVLHGHLVKFKRESGRTGDEDYHLVVTDETLQFSPGGHASTPSPHSIVAEIVRPECVVGRHGQVTSPSQFEPQLLAVRQKFHQQFPNISGGWNDAGGIPVVITGVGFFDRAHGQVGRMASGLELHPVLDISFDGGTEPPVPAITPALANPGFENGEQGWSASKDVITRDSTEPARTGAWKAWLGGYGQVHTDNLYQQITIPAEITSATLTYYLHISTEEQTTTEAFDRLRVQVRDASSSVLQTHATYSNLQAAPGYSLRTLNLTAYRGRTIRIYFQATEDSGSMTSFVLDDFKLAVE